MSPTSNFFPVAYAPISNKLLTLGICLTSFVLGTGADHIDYTNHKGNTGGVNLCSGTVGNCLQGWLSVTADTANAVVARWSRFVKDAGSESASSSVNQGLKKCMSKDKMFGVVKKALHAETDASTGGALANCAVTSDPWKNAKLDGILQLPEGDEICTAAKEAFKVAAQSCQTTKSQLIGAGYIALYCCIALVVLAAAYAVYDRVQNKGCCKRATYSTV